MTKVSTWFRVALSSTVLVICNVVPPPFSFAQSNSCPFTKSLTITPDKQKTDSWCGVATARIVMDYVYFGGLAPAQCDLTSRIASAEVAPLSALDCCDLSQQFVFNCSTNRWPEEIFDSLRFNYLNPLTGPLHLPLAWNEVIGEICDEDRPYISTITPVGGSTHSVIVHGYSWGVWLIVKFSKIKKLLVSQVQVYDPYDDVSYWDIERFGLTSFPSYSHEGDTYKIRKMLRRPPGLIDTRSSVFEP